MQRYAPELNRRIRRELKPRYRCRVVPYLNNIVEQDQRAINGGSRRASASALSRTAERTIQGYEAMHMIREGQVRCLARATSLNKFGL